MQVTKIDIFWNYVSSLLRTTYQIILLPLIVIFLSTPELGMWFIFGSISSLVLLLDLGFSNTFLRNFIYSWSGATSIKVEGLPKIDSGKSGPNFKLFYSILGTSKVFYRLLSLVIFIIMITLGFNYIRQVNLNNNLQEFNYFLEWFLYSTGTSISILYGFYNPLLRGIGMIKSSSISTIISIISQFLFTIFGFLFNYGLIALSLGKLISAIALGLVSKYFYEKNQIGQPNTFIPSLKDFKEIFLLIIPNSLKLGSVIVGSWLILKSSTFLVGLYFDVSVVATYGLTLSLVGVIGELSSLLFATFSPSLINSQMIGNFSNFRRDFSFTIFFQWIVSILGLVFLILFGNFLLEMIGSNSRLLTFNYLLPLSIILFLEWNHSTFAGYLSLTNRIPFLKASLVSGVLILLLSFILLNFFEIGLFALIIPQGLIQLLYNNWFWPNLVFKELNLSILIIINESLGYFKKKISLFLRKYFL